MYGQWLANVWQCPCVLFLNKTFTRHFKAQCCSPSRCIKGNQQLLHHADKFTAGYQVYEVLACRVKSNMQALCTAATSKTCIYMLHIPNRLSTWLNEISLHLADSKNLCWLAVIDLEVLQREKLEVKLSPFLFIKGGGPRAKMGPFLFQLREGGIFSPLGL